MAIGRWSEGEKPPLVIRPTSLPSPSRTRAPSRTGWRPSTSNPTRFCRGRSPAPPESASRPGKPPSAPALADRELQPGHYRRRVEVDVVPVERQARLEPKQIARAQPDRPHALVGKERVRHRFDRARGNRNLEPVLAGIARAADPRLLTCNVERITCMNPSSATPGAMASSTSTAFGPEARAAPAPAYGRRPARAGAPFATPRGPGAWLRR